MKQQNDSEGIKEWDTPRETAVIALADDNAMIRATLSRLLTERGYPTIPCSSGAELQEIVQRERPDLVITDLQMERPDAGIKVIQHMRSASATATTPVILFSADFAYLREQTGPLTDPHCTILDKSFSLDTLLATIAKLVDPAHLDEVGDSYRSSSFPYL